MTTPDRGPADFDVPVSAVGAPNARRARLAAVVVVAVVGAGVGLAAVSGNTAMSPAPTASPAAIAATTTPGPSRRSNPVATPGATAVAPEPRLPEVANVALPGAPEPVFFRRSGADLEILGWPAGETLRRVRSLPHAYAGIAADRYLAGRLSPDARRAVLRTVDAYAGDLDDEVRVVDGRGVAWRRSGVTALGEPLWSDDARSLAIPISRNEWQLLVFGARSPRVVELDVTGITLRSPPPEHGFISEPIGFSADGRWLYGEARSNVDPSYNTSFRVTTSGGRAEPVESLPTTGPSRLIAASVDPATGRRIDPDGSPFTGEARFVVLDEHGRRAFDIAFPAIFGTAWLADGRAVVMKANSWDEPKSVALVPIGRDGQVGHALFEAGPLSAAAILGARDGFVLMGFVASQRETEVLLVLLRADDRAATGLHLSARQLEGLQPAGWLP